MKAPIVLENTRKFAGLIIRKTNENGQLVQGATLALYKQISRTKTKAAIKPTVTWELVEMWDTTDENPKYFNSLPIGTYKVVEVNAPAGFQIAAEQTITLTEDDVNGDAVEFTMVDTHTRTFFEKVDENGDPLAGASVAVYEKDPISGELTEVARWTTTTTPHMLEGLTIGSSYIYRELETPTLGNYMLADDIEFIAYNDLYVTMVDYEYDLPDVHIKKVDANGNPLIGASFTIDRGRLIKDRITGETTILWSPTNISWTNTDSNEETLLDVSTGTYRVVETAAPNGYYLADPVEFTLTKNNYGETIEIEMVDEPTKIGFLKVDQNGNPAAGAILQVLEYCDDTGEETLIEEWESYGSLVPHYISGRLLTASQANPTSISYILREVAPPTGCEAAEDIWFSVPNTKPAEDSPIVITMVNEIPAHVFVEKVDENGDPVIGAELSVYTNEGANHSDVLLCSFTTDGEPYDIGYVKQGVTVTIVETQTPTGYTPPENAITHTITANDCFAGIDVTITVVNVTKLLPVYIEKRNSAGTRMAGAQFDVYVVEPGETEYELYRSFTSTTEPYSLGDWRVGTQIKVVETSAPANFAIADPVFFTVTDSEQTHTIVVTDKKLPFLNIQKIDATTHQPLAGATLKVEVSSNGGSTFTTATTFQTTTATHDLGYYEPGTIIRITETIAPASYNAAPVITYTVTEASYDQTVTITVEDYPTTVLTGVGIGGILPAAILLFVAITMAAGSLMLKKRRQPNNE